MNSSRKVDYRKDYKAIGVYLPIEVYALLEKHCELLSLDKTKYLKRLILEKENQLNDEKETANRKLQLLDVLIDRLDKLLSKLETLENTEPNI